MLCLQGVPDVPLEPPDDSLWEPRPSGRRGRARPSGVPRGPATSTGSLASQRHPGPEPQGSSPIMTSISGFQWSLESGLGIAL